MNAETETYKGYEIEIDYDQSPESPRDWENICIIHLGHSNYSFGDKNYHDRQSIDDAYHEAKRNGDIVLPLYMYEHGGCTISLGSFSCSWDSGQVGFVQIPRKKMIEEFGKKNFTPKLKEIALQHAKSEVETLDSYIRGDVYGYTVGEDSCWGYYSIEDAMAEAKSAVDWIVEEEKKIAKKIVEKTKKKHCEQVKTWIKNNVPLHCRYDIKSALSAAV